MHALKTFIGFGDPNDLATTSFIPNDSKIKGKTKNLKHFNSKQRGHSYSIFKNL